MQKTAQGWSFFVECVFNHLADDNRDAFWYDENVTSVDRLLEKSSFNVPKHKMEKGKLQLASQTRVLIADDQRSVREALRCLLALSPQVEIVGEAVDGQTAVHLVPECQPDVVLMDIKMPVMNGLEAAHRIKNRWPGVRVIILTMYGSYRTDALASGAVMFLVKGCTCEALQHAILAR